MASKSEPQLEVSVSGVETTPQAEVKSEYPKVFINRDGHKRPVYSISQQVAAEFDGYALESAK